MNSRSEIASSLRFDLLFPHKGDPLCVLLKLIYIVEASIQVVHDFTSFSPSSSSIINELKCNKQKYQRKQKLIKDFNYIIQNIRPLPTPEEILKLTGDVDNLLIEYFDHFMEQNELERSNNN